MYTILSVIIVLLILFTVAIFYSHKAHQQMLDAMLPGERKLYEAKLVKKRNLDEARRELRQAEREHKQSVKNAESELKSAKSKYAKDVNVSEKLLEKAKEQGRQYLGSYSSVYSRKIELWQDRILMPQVNTRGGREKQLSKIYYLENGRIRATVDSTGSFSFATYEDGPIARDTRELYLSIEGAEFASIVHCNPADGLKVREFAAQINNASKTIYTLTKDREQSVSQAEGKLNEVRNDCTAIETATKKLELAKQDTISLSRAEERVKRMSAALDEDPDM